MKNSELYVLQQGILSVGALKGVKFAVVVAKNLKKINEELEAFNKAQAGSDKFNEYNTAREAMAKAYADKDEDGNPVIDGAGLQKKYRLEDRLDEFNVAWDALKEKHTEAVEERETQMQEVKELMDEESTVELLKASESILPEDITPDQLFSILDIIEE